VPDLSDSLARARSVTAFACEKAALLLERSAQLLSDLASRVAEPPDVEDGMESFWDREDSNAPIAFREWREKNSQGFVMNCKTAGDMMLHRPDCPHFEFRPGTKVSLTKNRKICSLDREQLERWAEQRGSLEPCECLLVRARQGDCDRTSIG